MLFAVLSHHGAVLRSWNGGNLFQMGAGRDIFALAGEGGTNVLADDSTFDFALDRVAIVGQGAPEDLEAFITERFVAVGDYSGLEVNGTMFLSRGGQAGLTTLQDWLIRGSEILEFHQSTEALLSREGLDWAI